MKLKDWIEELRTLAQMEIDEDLKNDITDHNAEPLCTLKLIAEIESMQAVCEAAEVIDWEGIILLVDEYPVAVKRLRAFQRALQAWEKGEKDE